MDEQIAGLGARGLKLLTGFLDGLRIEAPILPAEHDKDAVFALAKIGADAEVRRAYRGDGPEACACFRCNKHRLYGASQALSGADLSAAKGKVAARMGRNRMGKPTTKKAIFRTMSRRDGVVRIAGADQCGVASFCAARAGSGR